MLTAIIIVARVQPGTSKGITDLLLPQPSSVLTIFASGPSSFSSLAAEYRVKLLSKKEAHTILNKNKRIKRPRKVVKKKEWQKPILSFQQEKRQQEVAVTFVAFWVFNVKRAQLSQNDTQARM